MNPDHLKMKNSATAYLRCPQSTNSIGPREVNFFENPRHLISRRDRRLGTPGFSLGLAQPVGPTLHHLDTRTEIKPDGSRYLAGVSIWNHHFNSSGAQPALISNISTPTPSALWCW